MAVGADPMIGRVLDGRYRIDARIARGGMATVYEAHDLRLNRICAVKVMHPAHVHDTTSQRFVREAHSAARLSHRTRPVPTRGRPGRLFSSWARPRLHAARLDPQVPMPPTRSMRPRAILLALADAHRAVVHRDTAVDG